VKDTRREDRLLREHKQQEEGTAAVEMNDLNEPNEAPTVVRTKAMKRDVFPVVND
jgi:hypothetical protein